MEKPVVLIVDGDCLVRMSAVHMVEDAGYSALEAHNADNAIKMLESREDIRAVFTDINMAGSMDGLRLAHAIRHRWPPTHLIVTSGLDLHDQLPANSRFIQKPYSAEQVTAALDDLFGRNPAPGGISGALCQNYAKLA
jgi:CheY-like chemotaxis protein